MGLPILGSAAHQSVLSHGIFPDLYRFSEEETELAQFCNFCLSGGVADRVLREKNENSLYLLFMRVYLPARHKFLASLTLGEISAGSSGSSLTSEELFLNPARKLTINGLGS